MKISFSCAMCFSPTSKSAVNDLQQGLKTLQNVHVYSYMDLKAATQGFRSSNKIGKGGFGCVYKGQLQDGRKVAIKVLSVESKQGDREFMAEIEGLSNVKHKNLIKLHGCCIDGSNRILVYDYMEKNSLSQTLLGGEQNKAKFSWEARRDVALGVAHGLVHLHEQVKPHIIHRDIKASNILLDRDFNPKISDFGLSKLFSDNITHISTRIAGTLGYLAPEYAISGHLTRKSDIYSFGVLLLEIISGRRGIDFDLELGEYYLVEKAWEMYKAGELLQLVDPILKGKFSAEEAIRFLKVGLLCVQETHGLRPQMSKAIKMMSNEIDIEGIEISQPGFVTNFMGVKTVPQNSSQGSHKGSTSNKIRTPGSHPFQLTSTTTSQPKGYL